MAGTGFEKSTIVFLGPRPSEALKLAPLVQAGLVIWGALQIAYAALNLLEVRLLQNRNSGLTASSQEAVVKNIHHLQTTNFIIQIAFWPTLILSILWNRKRRSRAILRQQGELYVGTRYTEISHGLAIAYWVLLAAIVVTNLFAVTHGRASFEHLVRVRELLTLGAMARFSFAVVCFEMIRRACKDQRRREALPVVQAPASPA